MNDHPVLHAFPRRPIALVRDPARARRRLVLLIGVLLLFVPLIWFAGSTIHTRALRADLRARGVPAEVIDAQGSCYSRRNISGDTPRGCNLDIRYRTQEGGAERSAKVYLPGAAPLVFAPPVLYDPQDPARVMTKADVDRGDPFMNLAVPFVLFTLLPLVALLVWFATGDGKLRKAAAAPRPGIVPILRATATRAPTGSSPSSRARAAGPTAPRPSQAAGHCSSRRRRRTRRDGNGPLRCWRRRTGRCCSTKGCRGSISRPRSASRSCARRAARRKSSFRSRSPTGRWDWRPGRRRRRGFRRNRRSSRAPDRARPDRPPAPPRPVRR